MKARKGVRTSHDPEASGLSLQTYRYYDKSTFGLDFNGLCEDVNVSCMLVLYLQAVSAVQNAKDGSIFMFHACAHNPTGVDPTPEQALSLAPAVGRQVDAACSGRRSPPC